MIASVDRKPDDQLSLHGAAMAGMDVYSAFLMGACHALGSPLGALLSNISLAREDLTDLVKMLREGPSLSDQLLPLAERVHSDLGDAQRLVERLKASLIEVRSIPGDSAGEPCVSLLDVLELAVKFGASTMFRGARLTTNFAERGSREEFMVRGEGNFILRLVLGSFFVVASAQRDHMDSVRFHADVSQGTDSARLRIEGHGPGSSLSPVQFQTFSELFTMQGGSMLWEEHSDSCVVIAEFARYA